MAFVALIIGAILIVTALNNTYPALAKELEADVPGFFKWAMALVAILAIGYIPGLKTPVRWLLAVAIVALLLMNTGGITTNLINAFKAFGTGRGAPSSGGGGGSSSSAPGAAAAGGAGAGIGAAMSQAMSQIGSFFGSAAG